MKFTLFTPIFNRERVFDRVWKSIRAQMCRDFGWIVVDHGSTDGSFAKCGIHGAFAVERERFSILQDGFVVAGSVALWKLRRS